MADIDDGLDEAFKGFGEDPAPVTPPADPATPPAADPPKEEPKPADEPKAPETPDKKTPEGEQPPAADDKKEEENPQPPKAPETPPAGGAEEPKAPEAPQPLTKDDVKSVVSDLLNSERTSGKELETTTNEVLEKYYPEGLSNVLVTPEGKELKTPQDVVDASNGEMSTDQAAQWLMNEQFKLDKAVDKIKSDAKDVATVNINFKRDAVTALTKYEPLFKAYPQLQGKVYEKLMKQVKVDKDRGLILSAPDVLEHYDDFLEPYQQAFEFSTNKSATNPTPPPGGEPPKPGAEDRMDEGGDAGGGGGEVNDPNDFAQQVKKELAGGF